MLCVEKIHIRETCRDISVVNKIVVQTFTKQLSVHLTKATGSGVSDLLVYVSQL